MKNFRLLLLVVLLATIFSESCSRQKFEGYQLNENGVYYIDHYRSGDTVTPKLNEWVTVRMDYRLEDSVLFSSKDLGKPLRFSMLEPEFSGDLYHALSLMSIGDSITFAIPADSFFIHTAKMKKLPANVEAGSYMFYDLKLSEILTDEEFKQEIESQKAILMEKELQVLHAYVDSAGITEKPKTSGLYFIPLKTGTGKKPDTGDMCRIHLKVQQMKGPLLYNNFGLEPIEVEYGKQFDTEGFREGLGMLKEGGKAQLIVPSPIGVGEQGRESVPPFTSVIYEVELVAIVSLEEVKIERARRKKARAEENERLKEAEPVRLEAYLKQHNITTDPLPSGLYFLELEKGSGAIPKTGEKVRVHYRLTRVDGREIQNSYKKGEAYEFLLGQGSVIKAWDEAVALMNRGSKAKIIVPSSLAYGSRGRGMDIGPYTTLIFELELLED